MNYDDLQKVKENDIFKAESLLYMLHCVSPDNKKLTPWPPLLKIEGGKSSVS
jgi:hypothetical protein